MRVCFHPSREAKRDPRRNEDEGEGRHDADGDGPHGQRHRGEDVEDQCVMGIGDAVGAEVVGEELSQQQARREPRQQACGRDAEDHDAARWLELEK